MPSFPGTAERKTDSLPTRARPQLSLKINNNSLSKPFPNVFRRFHRSPVLIIICIILTVSLLLHSYSNPRRHLTNVARQRLKHLQSSYLTSHEYARDEREWEIRLGNVDYDAYVRDIQHSWHTLFRHDERWLFRNGGASGLVPLRNVLEWLDIGSQPTSSSTEGQIPHRLHFTSKIPPSQYPHQWKGWAEKDPSLSFRYLNDSAMDIYLNETFPSPSPMSQVLSSVHKPVLKADILRYALLLRDGGIYTDVDTSAVRPFKDWGTLNALDLTDSMLGALPLYLKGSPTSQRPPPGIIVSLESTGVDNEWKRKTFVRGIQIVQWTMAAKSCHPIFIDALAHVVKKHQEAIKQGTANSDTLDILDWTGPGTFTDAVLRYLVARHGIHPRQIADLGRPARIGDLLILPAESFAAWASEEPKGEQQSVWHGFFGSWKAEA